MTGITRDLLGLLRVLIARETRFLRHFIGQVRDVQDPLARGRVLVLVPELGWTDNSTGAWCWPRDKHSMVVPEVGEWVEVYFVNGDASRPVYLGQVAEINGQVPADYEKPATRVIWEDPKTGDYARYDQEAKELEIRVQGDTVAIKNDEVDLHGDSKSLVTYAELNSALQSFLTALKAAVASGCQAGSGGNISSVTLDISGAEAQKVKTS